MGKNNWKIENIRTNFIVLFKQKYPNLNIIEPADMYIIIAQYKNQSLEVISELYIREVIDEKVEWNSNKKIAAKRDELAREEFENTKSAPSDSFDELPIEEKEKRRASIIIDDSSIKQIQNIEYQEAYRIARLTLQRILELEKNGKLKSPYSAIDIILSLTEGEPKQEDYLVETELDAWKEHFCDGISPITDDTIVDVYCFQCGDIGANNFITFGGNVGPKDGLFVFGKRDYERLKADTSIFDKNGNCIDIPKLSANLGNVFLGTNPICIHQKVRFGDLKTSNGNLSTAYFGEFGPPLSTQGGYDKDGRYISGMYEAIAPLNTFVLNGEINPNIEIISHSQNISTQELVKMAKVLLSKSEKFAKIESLTAYDLLRRIDNDYELLKKFKEILSREEQVYISQLMIYLKNEMQREAVATIGGGLK